MFYTVFSTNVSPKMQWQSDLLEFSWKRVKQEGQLVRLVATADPGNLPKQKHARCIATTCWDTDPDSGDSYPIYNKPASLLEWVYREKPEGTVLLLDPDCVFRAPVRKRVAPGYPAAQDWIDYGNCATRPDGPFGLGSRFSFLNEYCARTDLTIAPVMIPKLIHTQDLRRIAARWLELCRIVRKNARNAEGKPLWESDMFAYLATCAEYGLKHEPISLGICTNWAPADVPDAPIIHYCQSIRDKNGKTVFNKHTYRPWSRINADVELDRDGDLVTLINEFVDSGHGLAADPAPSSSRPRCRDGIKEGQVLDDFLLERPEDGANLWLNGSGKAVWKLCDGSRTIEGIADELAARFDTDRDVMLPEICAIVGKLHAVAFLDLKDPAIPDD